MKLPENLVPHKKKLMIGGSIALIILAGSVYSKVRPEPPAEFSTTTVSRIDLVQSVSETGSIAADLKVSYGWEVSGKIVSVLKKVGDAVLVGDPIAQVDSVKQRARLNEALASLSSAQARLNLEVAGPNNPQIDQSLASVDQAKAGVLQAEANLEKAKVTATTQISSAEKAVETALNNLQLSTGGDDSQIVRDAYANLVNTLKLSMTTLDSALRTSDNILGIDNPFANDDFDEILGALDSSALNRAEQSYLTMKATFRSAESAVQTLAESSAQSTIDTTAGIAQDAFSAMQSHLFDVRNLLNATPPIGNLSQAELDALRASVTNAQSSVSTAASNVTAGKQAVTAARTSRSTYQIAYDKAVLDLSNTRLQTVADVAISEAQLAAQHASLKQAEAAYDVLVAAPRGVDLAPMRADVARAAANVDAVRDDYEKTTLVAAVSGVITTLDAKTGENAAMNQPLVTIESPRLNVEVDISESDIAKISLGDSATITLDALGEDIVFEGEVVAIDPAETEIAGIVYYKTKIVVTSEVLISIKPGMTANVDIITDRRGNVLVIPERAIIVKDGKKIVRVVTNKTTGAFEERVVETGLRGDNGQIEITKGLEVGEEIVTFIREE